MSVLALDNDAKNGGDKRDDILDDRVYETLLRRAHRGDFLGIFAAPPCSTFTFGRFIRSPTAKDGGPPVVRRRHANQVLGSLDCPPAHRKEVQTANLLISRTCAILRAGVEAGSEFIVENPADRGDPTRPELFLEPDHAPLWVMPDILELSKYAHARQVTFPMCAFGVDYLKHTTLLFSPGMAPGLEGFELLRCTHGDSHRDRAGGIKTNGVWNSASKAAYPSELNVALAKAFRLLLNSEPLPLDKYIRREEPRAGHSVPAALMPPPAAAVARDPHEQPRMPEATPRLTAPAAAAPSSPSRQHSATPSTLPPEPPRLSELAAPPTPASKSPTAAPKTSTAYPGRPAGYVPEAHRPTAERPDLPSTNTRYASRNAGRAQLAQSDASLSPSLMLLSKEAPHDSTSSSGPDALRPDPKTHASAMKDDAQGWTKAEEAELANHANNGSFQLMDKSEFEREAPGRRLIKLIWVYKRKRNGKMKARLCVQGCCQQPGVDYDQTHCGTMRGASLRMLSALAGQYQLKMRRWDFVSAYLQGQLEPGEVVYCLPPPGPYSTNGADGRPRVWKVVKPVYGMAQAGRRWQRALFPWLTSWGLKACEADPCVFHLKREVDTPKGKRLDTLIVGCYVDDLFILYNHDDEYSLYHQFTTDLSKRWEVDDEGEVADLLNIEIVRGEHHVLLRQTSYIEKLAAAWLANGPPSHIQMNSTPHTDELPSQVLDAALCEDERDPELVRNYQSLVGSLLYAATNTRPDVAYAVGMLCRAMSRPTPDLYEAALRVLAYLCRHKHIGLRYEASPSPLSGMADADWAVRHSTSGYVFTLARAAISWGSKRQPTIALSSCEAEIMAASEASKEAIYLDRLLKELGYRTGNDPIHLSLDNKAAIDSSYNPENHARTKHIERRHYFIRELVEMNQIVVPYVPSDENLADFFTKPLKAARFYPMRNKIMNIYSE